MTEINAPTLLITKSLKARSLSSVFDVDVAIKCLQGENYYATNLPLTGYTVWFGAHNLVDLAASDIKVFDKCRVLELGSGLGFAGISIAKMAQAASGPSEFGQYVLTDGEAELIPLLKDNCELNGLSAEETKCLKLWWGDSDDISSCSSFAPDGFDIIIGADLIYSQQQLIVLPSLFSTVDSLLSRRGDSRFYLAVTRRNYDIGELFKAADAVGLTWEVDPNTIYDIFSNNTDEQTDLWRDAVYIFRRNHSISDFLS
jgi:hypothetical protein